MSAVSQVLHSIRVPIGFDLYRDMRNSRPPNSADIEIVDFVAPLREPIQTDEFPLQFGHPLRRYINAIVATSSLDFNSLFTTKEFII